MWVWRKHFDLDLVVYRFIRFSQSELDCLTQYIVCRTYNLFCWTNQIHFRGSPKMDLVGSEILEASPTRNTEATTG